MIIAEANLSIVNLSCIQPSETLVTLLMRDTSMSSLVIVLPIIMKDNRFPNRSLHNTRRHTCSISRILRNTVLTTYESANILCIADHAPARRPGQWPNIGLGINGKYMANLISSC